MSRVASSLILVIGILISIFGQETETFHHPGDSLFRQQSYSKAIEVYENCIHADSSDIQCWYGLGESAFALGNLTLAKTAFQKTLRDSTLEKQSWKYFASIFESEENSALAIKYYLALAREDSLNGYYWRKIGQQYQRAGLITEAFNYFRRAYHINPQDQYTVTALAEIFLSNRQNEEADSILQAALALDSTHIKFNLLTARSFYQQRKYRAVSSILESLHERIDLSNYYAKMAGFAFLQIDSLDKAIYFLQNSLQNESDPEHAEYYLAVAFEKKGDLATAKYYFEKAVESGLSDNLGLYHRRLASIAHKENLLKSAIKHYEAAQRYEPDPENLIHLGMLSAEYYADKNIAIRYFQRYLNSSIAQPEYEKYALEQIKYLKDLQHMQFNN